MRFARVTGTLSRTVDDRGGAVLALTVTLDDGARVWTVRAGPVLDIPVPADIPDAGAWLADQYVQETIANELAEQGWEVVSGGEAPAPVPDGRAALSAVAVTYLVRQP